MGNRNDLIKRSNCREKGRKEGKNSPTWVVM